MANLADALRTPAAQNLLAAVAAGATVLSRPARFPSWARRGLSLANTAGTVGTVIAQQRNGGAPKGALEPASGKAETNELLSVASAASAGIMLATSGIGLKVDAKVERWLLDHGVKHPRIFMAVGVVGVVWVVKTAQDVASSKIEKKAKQLAAKATGKSDSAEGNTRPAN